MRLSFLLVFPWLILSLSSCFDGDDSSNSKDNGYRGYVPNFSVSYPRSITTSNLLLKSMMRAAPSVIPSLELEEEPDRIDCSDAIINWNKATRLPNDATGLSSVPYCPTDSGNPIDCFNNELGVVLHFYAQSQFYDCNARQQLQEDGLTKQCRLRDGTTGNIGGDDLCDPGASSYVQLLYSLTEGASADDLTRFVSWTMHPTTPKTKDIKGQLINKYLQGDGMRSKTRVDIDRIGGKKVIDSVLLVANAAGDIVSIARAYFREAGSGDPVTDNYITGRYWHKDYAKVIAVRAHVSSTLGSAVFYRACAAATALDAVIAVCSLAGVTAKSFNSNGGTESSAITGLTPTSADSKFDPRSSSDKLDTFFDTRTIIAGNVPTGIETVIANYFDPDRFSPAN